MSGGLSIPLGGGPCCEAELSITGVRRCGRSLCAGAPPLETQALRLTDRAEVRRASRKLVSLPLLAQDPCSVTAPGATLAQDMQCFSCTGMGSH